MIIHLIDLREIFYQHQVFQLLAIIQDVYLGHICHGGNVRERHDVHSRSWHGFIPTRGERGGDSHLYSDSYSELAYIISAVSVIGLTTHALNFSNAESPSKPLIIAIIKYAP